MLRSRWQRRSPDDDINITSTHHYAHVDIAALQPRMPQRTDGLRAGHPMRTLAVAKAKAQAKGGLLLLHSFCRLRLGAVLKESGTVACPVKQ